MRDAEVAIHGLHAAQFSTDRFSRLKGVPSPDSNPRPLVGRASTMYIGPQQTVISGETFKLDIYYGAFLRSLVNP